jgi:transposase
MSTPKRYVTISSEEDKIRLEYLFKNSPNHRERQRCECLLLSSAGHDIDSLSNRFNVQRETITFWFKRWETNQFSTLKDAHRSGRRSVITEEIKKKLIQS